MTALRVESQPGHTEGEMTRNQCGLVDTCFEEGQYDSGLTVLDQLRSPNHKPAAFHIRQVLYIALYPLTYKGKNKPIFDPTASPSKLNRQQKTFLIMASETIAAAQRLLMAFAYTNSPQGVFRVVPSFQGETLDNGDLDSVIAHESLCITRVKSCWNILVDGFVEQTIAPKPKGKGRRAPREDDEDDATGDLPAPIGENVWPVLEWIVVVFERDEGLTETEDIPRYSPLLLSQLPVPRGTDARWEFNAPLDVVFYCLEQNDEKRQILGARLMTLMIHLSSTIYIDYALFIVSVYTRVFKLSLPKLSQFFASLNTSPSILKFKIALCQKFIDTTNVKARSVPRPKPQPRGAQPKPKPSRATDEPGDAKGASASGPPPGPRPIASKHLIPSTAEIRRLMEMDVPATEPSSWRLKFEILLSYGTYQARYAVDKEKDPEWSILLGNGELGRTLDTAFPPNLKDDVASSYRETLRSIMTTW